LPTYSNGLLALFYTSINKALQFTQTITISRGREKSLERQHPWVFSGAVYKKSDDIEEGDTIQVLDGKQNFLGMGHYQDGSICVRILSFENVAIDQDFWNGRIKDAVSYRLDSCQLPNESTNCYRLIHGEGDGLPGLIIDIYGQVAVVQCHSIGMYKSLELIKQALLHELGDTITHIYCKSKDSLPTQVEMEDSWLHGSALAELTVKENGYDFIIDFENGRKTGFFLDQRENRALLGNHSKDKSVLNCFCYTGGFSIYSLQNGASKVDSIDISKTAMVITDRNVELTNMEAHHQSITANVMEYLKDDGGETYDVVVIDPPAFAKSVSKRHNAVQAYKRLNVLAIKKVKSGGLLFTFSCSQVVGTQLFYDTMVAAAIEAGRKVRVMQHLSQGADHPVNLFHPEGHYLKGLMLQII